NGAEPGDLLEIKILEVEPASFGFTVQIPGFGFLRDQFPDPFIVRWRIADGAAESAELPGVRIHGAPFPGTIGLAPSRALMQAVTKREKELLDRGGMVLPPDPTDAVPNDSRLAAEALRTVPPRETAGNVDIKALCAGTTMLIPVQVEGALFSVGDDHFQERGYSRQQAYAICSVAVDLKISEVVDVPNFVVSAVLPLDIFV